jgi:probable HAF family extracellular repeat protein
MQSASSPQLFGATVHALNDYSAGHPSLTLVGYTSRDINGNLTGHQRGFAWRPFNTANPVTVLGTLGGSNSVAHDVNSAGDIVGYSDTKRAGHHAFIFKNNKLTDLNSQVDLGGKVLQWATAINDSGDITGFMDIPRPVNEQRGFMLRLK